METDVGVNRRLLDVVAAFLSDRAREGDINSARNQRAPTVSQRTATFGASAPGIDLAHPGSMSAPRADALKVAVLCETVGAR